MIQLSMVVDTNESYEYVRCPTCGKGRLCDKPKDAKVSLLQIAGKGLEHVVVKCPRCSARYLITATED